MQRGRDERASQYPSRVNAAMFAVNLQAPVEPR
jgi:hypothetical protein